MINEGVTTMTVMMMIIMKMRRLIYIGVFGLQSLRITLIKELEKLFC